MQKILVIEDGKDTQLILQALLGERYQLVLVNRAQDVPAALQAHEYDLVLLDVSLPDGDGFGVFAQLKGEPSLKDVPVVFLTGKSEVNDRVAAFSLGADDYVVKPFEPREFRARIDAKLGARLKRAHARDVIRKGRLEIDRATLRVSATDAAGRTSVIDLTPHELKLLMHFATHEGHVLSRDQLITAAWGAGTHVLERTVDRHVSSLRRKLDARFEKIEAVPGEGYRFTLATSDPVGKRKAA